MAQYELSLIEGSQTIKIGQLIETMESIGVDYLCLNSFGMKSPIQFFGFLYGSEVNDFEG